MEKAQNETVPTSNHKFILNKPMFVLTAVIGAICTIAGALAGFYMAGGHIALLFYAAEVVTILGITIGALFFSYGFTAFEPWLVPIGVGIPEEEEIIKKYIKICESASSILLIAAFFTFILGVINTMQYLNDTELIGSMAAAALTPFVLSLGAMMVFVVPTKCKLELLLTDRQVFETKQREEQH
ncbi:MAG: motility-associated protein [Verrucomicrobiota bacterium]|nr:motility-associated protein [Verrucomicrobiota bacterium]